jgi:hypothetical protein
LGRFSAHSAMRSDHLDAVSLRQIPIQTATVIGSVTDYLRRKGIEEAVSEEAFDELAFATGSISATTPTRASSFWGNRTIQEINPLRYACRPLRSYFPNWSIPNWTERMILHPAVPWRRWSDKNLL